MCKILKYNKVALYLSVFAKILQKDINKDQKRHKVDKRDSTTHEKSYKAKKLIFGPKITKISTRMQKNKKNEWDVPREECGK